MTNVSKLPPKGWNRVRLLRCRFRWRFHALNWFGWPERGVAYEWLGLRLELARNCPDL